MVLNRQGKNPMQELQPLMDAQILAQLQEQVSATHVSELVVEYAVNLITETRKHPDLLRGASPRATLSVIAVSKAVAQLRGRDYVVPKDVQEVFLRTVEHRLQLTTGAENSGVTIQNVLQDILKKVGAPLTK
jgi:MoxR-like ATPase